MEHNESQNSLSCFETVTFWLLAIASRIGIVYVNIASVTRKLTV